MRLNWRDLLAMLIMAELSLLIYRAPITALRTFPITFDGSGDIVYPQWAYPDRGWILSTWLAGSISIVVPNLVYVVAQLRIRSAWDASNAIMGSTWGLLMSSLFQVTVKKLIGGFRPYFLDACMPDISLARSKNQTGLNGVGFGQVMYTTEICTQRNRSVMHNAVTSFPSGHSASAFAGFIFLFLWLNAKLKVWADYRPSLWKLCLTIAPLLVAVLIACSLTINAAHNWYDIVAGSTIGTVMAVASYRSNYAAVFDWRFNHVPLRERESFSYDAEEQYGAAAQTIITRRARWGESRAWTDQQNEAAGTGHVLTRYPGKRRLSRGDAGYTSTNGSQPNGQADVGEEAV